MVKFRAIHTVSVDSHILCAELFFKKSVFVNEATITLSAKPNRLENVKLNIFW